MNSHPVLRYFDDGKGRAELPRLIFTYGDIPFENKTISFEEYKQMRFSGKLPFDQLPILELGDTTISQSCAIARYAAKEAGIYPLDRVQAASSDVAKIVILLAYPEFERLLIPLLIANYHQILVVFHNF